MKKITASLLGLAMMGAMMAPVHADETTTTLKYTKTSEYTLSIPATIIVSSVNETEQAIGVSAVNTNATDKVQISVKSGVGSDGKVTLNGTGVTTEVTASLTSKGSGIGANEVISEFQDQSTTPTKGGKLFFSAIPADALAGSYEGTIVFTASVVNR
mgnify:CR=1 FL=1